VKEVKLCLYFTSIQKQSVTFYSALEQPVDVLHVSGSAIISIAGSELAKKRKEDPNYRSGSGRWRRCWRRTRTITWGSSFAASVSQSWTNQIRLCRWEILSERIVSRDLTLANGIRALQKCWFNFSLMSQLFFKTIPIPYRVLVPVSVLFCPVHFFVHF
jgi:hypothetical protein